MKKTILIIVLAALCLNFRVQAQGTGTNIIPLSIGDTLSKTLLDMPLQVIKHSQGKQTITLNDYKGKILILDFWATWCGSCISNFPKMYLLQEKFSGPLQFLLINTKSTRDDEAKVLNFFEGRKNQYHFTSVINDVYLDQLFPHNSIPHYVWIKDSKVIAITDAEELNEQSITAMIKGQKPIIHEKPSIRYNPTKPYFSAKNNDTALFHSILSGYNEHVIPASTYVYGKNSLVVRIDFINCSLWSLYEHAYPELAKANKDRIRLRLKNPGALSRDSTSVKWRKENCFIYEATFPGCSKEEAQNFMRFDLAKYFRVKVDSEIVNVPCFILRTGDIDKISKAPDNSRPVSNVFENTNGPVYFTNESVKQIANGLETRYGEPFINETGYTQRISIHLPENFKDQAALRKALTAQGFALTKENRKIVYRVLSDYDM